MKYENLFVFLFLLIPLAVYGFVGTGFMGGSSPGVNWDLLDEDCSNFSDEGWTDADTGSAFSEISPAGQFHFDTNASAVDDDHARRVLTFAPPDTFTVEIRLFCDAIGTKANGDAFDLQFRSDGLDETFEMTFASDGLWTWDTDTGDVEIGTDLVSTSEWQVWRFLVDRSGGAGNATVDTYLNGALVGNDTQCSGEATILADEIYLTMYGETTDNQEAHLDYIKVATGLYVP